MLDVLLADELDEPELSPDEEEPDDEDEPEDEDEPPVWLGDEPLRESLR